MTTETASSDDIVASPSALTFSVVIPTFDRPVRLRESLDSLVAQRFPKNRFEVVIVDDGGTVPAHTVAAEYERSLTVAVCRQERAGPAAARNAGALRARARYIAFLDDDCRADPEWLHELETAFARAPTHSLLGGRVVNAAPDNVFAEMGELILDVMLDHFRPEVGGMYFFRAANLAASAAEFRGRGGFDVAFRTAEDRELCDRWLHAGGSLVYVPSARVVHLNRLFFRGFVRQHFEYGKGAFRFHRARRARGSGRFRVSFLWFYVRVFRAAFSSARGPLLAKLFLLLTWQAVNAAGFFAAMVHDTHRRKRRALA